MAAGCGGKNAMLAAARRRPGFRGGRRGPGALSNAGQTCVAAERIYLAQDVYHPFTEKPAANSNGGPLMLL